MLIPSQKCTLFTEKLRKWRLYAHALHPNRESGLGFRQVGTVKEALKFEVAKGDRVRGASEPFFSSLLAHCSLQLSTMRVHSLL